MITINYRGKCEMDTCPCYLKDRLWKIIFRSDLLTTRFTIALSSLVFAILLWWPGTLFTPARATYRIMAEIAPENVWGALFFIHFCFAAYTLARCNYNRLTFVGDALLGAALWTVSTVACFASHWQHGVPYAPPAAMSAEIGVLFASWWYTMRWIARAKR